MEQKHVREYLIWVYIERFSRSFRQEYQKLTTKLYVPEMMTQAIALLHVVNLINCRRGVSWRILYKDKQKKRTVANIGQISEKNTWEICREQYISISLRHSNKNCFFPTCSAVCFVLFLWGIRVKFWWGEPEIGNLLKNCVERRKKLAKVRITKEAVSSPVI